jgi:hypothetical protein
MTRPSPEEYPFYFEPYISKVAYDTIEDLLEQGHARIISFYMGIPDNRGDYRYGVSKKCFSI